jgi:hypothetical protein
MYFEILGMKQEDKRSMLFGTGGRRDFLGTHMLIVRNWFTMRRGERNG